ncbi:MAG: PDZ domain-containing protein [Planctomycetes bacterium]|nr:PDZ domain-containing protein [Planctomycetota bacterium]
MHRRHCLLALAAAILGTAPLVAQEVSPLVLRRTVAEDPLRVHVLPERLVEVGGYVLPEAALLAEVAHLPARGLVVITSEQGVPWERDTRLREAFVESGRPRDVVFSLPETMAEVVGERWIGPTEELEREVSAWVVTLGSGVWTERESATRILANLGQPALPYIRGARSETDDLEVEWRLDTVIRTLGEQMALRQGFLGIAYHYKSLEGVPAEKRGRAEVGAIAIQQVIQGTEAQRAGLMAGDLVFEMNRKPVGNPYGTARITRIFEGLRKGQTVSLSVLRDGVEITIPATMGAWRE